MELTIGVFLHTKYKLGLLYIKCEAEGHTLPIHFLQELRDDVINSVSRILRSSLNFTDRLLDGCLYYWMIADLVSKRDRPIGQLGICVNYSQNILCGNLIQILIFVSIELVKEGFKIFK